MSQKTMAAKDWVPILNTALSELRKHVDESGNGVFTFDEVFGKTDYLSKTATISRHLSALGLLRRMNKQADGRYLWHVDLKKKRIVLADVRRAREKSARRRKAEAGVRVPVQVSRSKPTKTAAKQSVSKPVGDSKPKPSSLEKPPADAVPVGTSSADLVSTDHVSQLKAADGRIAALVRVVAMLEAEVAELSAANTSLTAEICELRDHLGDSVNEQISAAADEVIGKYLT